MNKQFDGFQCNSMHVYCILDSQHFTRKLRKQLSTTYEQVLRLSVSYRSF